MAAAAAAASASRAGTQYNARGYTRMVGYRSFYICAIISVRRRLAAYDEAHGQLSRRDVYVGMWASCLGDYVTATAKQQR